MVILGIDPGTSRIGYGIIKKSAANKFKLLDAGLLDIGAKAGTNGGKYGRFWHVKNALDSLIKKFRPEVLSIEKLYFAKNQKTAISVAEMRGALILAALENGLRIEEYSPNEIKTGITGYGLADKKAVLKMVKLTLGEPDLDIIDDASDALAVAIMAASNRIGRVAG